MTSLGPWIAIAGFGVSVLLGPRTADALPRVTEKPAAAAPAERAQPPSNVVRLDPLRGPMLEPVPELPEAVEGEYVIWFNREISARISTSGAGLESALVGEDLLELLHKVELLVQDKHVEVRLIVSRGKAGYVARGAVFVPMGNPGSHRWGGQAEGRVDVQSDFDGLDVNGSAGLTVELNSETGVQLPAGVTLRPVVTAGIRGGDSGLWVLARIDADVYSDGWLAEDPAHFRIEAGVGTPGFTNSSDDASSRLDAEPTFTTSVSVPVPSLPNVRVGVEASLHSGDLKSQVFVRVSD